MKKSLSEIYNDLLSSINKDDKVTLNAAFFGDNPGITDDMLQQYFPDTKGVLEIDGLKAEDLSIDNPPTTITLKGGQGTGLPFKGMTFKEAIIQQDANKNFSLSVEATGTGTNAATWHLSDRFPTIFAKNSSMLLDMVEFSDPLDLYWESPALEDSDEDPEKINGFYIEAKLALNPPSPFDVLSPFLDAKDLGISGQIEMIGEAPDMTLNLKVKDESLPIGPFKFDCTEISIASDASLNSASSWNPETQKFDFQTAWKPVTYFQLSSVIDFNDSESLVLETGFINPVNGMIFKAEIEPPIGTSLNALASFASPKSPVELKPVGQTIRYQDDIQFQQLVFSLGKGLKPEALTLKIGTGKDEIWNIFNTFRMEHIRVQFRLDLDTLKLDGSFSGDVLIGTSGGAMFLNAEFGENPVFYGNVIQPIPVADFISFFMHQSADGHFAGLDLYKFDFNLNPHDKSFSGDVEIAGDWSIIPHKAYLESILFQINRNATDGTQLTLTATLHLENFEGQDSDAEIAVEGNYQPKTGWDIKGSYAVPVTKEGKQPKANDFAGKIDTLLGVSAMLNGASAGIPSGLADLQVDSMDIAFNTQSKNFSFSLTLTDTNYPDSSFVLEIHFVKDETGYTKTFSGKLTVEKTNPDGSDFSLEFDLIFLEDVTKTAFIAAYQNPSGGTIHLATLLPALTTAKAPPGLDISLKIKDALLLIDRPSGKAVKAFMGIDMDAGIDLAHLPLVGKIYPHGLAANMTFLLQITSDHFTKEDFEDFTPLLPDNITPLPEQDVNPGVTLDVNLWLGKEKTTLNSGLPSNFATTNGESDKPRNSEKDSTPPAPKADIQWFNLQKKIGPVTLNKIGVQFDSKEKAVEFLLDADLSADGLAINLDGLYVRSPLDPIQPTFGLQGLSLDFQKEDLEVGGGFLRTVHHDKTGDYVSYDGIAHLKLETLTIAALGSYSYYQQHPSLFLFAALDSPLGGPSFFFVTGLAAGFGYNRSVRTPSIDQVASFPLVDMVVSGPLPTPPNLNDPDPAKPNGIYAYINTQMATLSKWVQPDYGQEFLVAGIRFTSFEMLDTFLLAMVSFGKHFEIDVLGISTLILPTPEDGDTTEPLAEVQMAVVASYDPGKGVFELRSQLTPSSYFLSKACHLTGGSAFFAWSKDQDSGARAGDFVISFGGYHPDFQKPAYYPDVAQVGFDWQLDQNINIQGHAYMALTPSAVMAGGYLAATGVWGALKAWFDIGANMLISWKPYHYQFDAFADIGVQYTFHLCGTHHISVELGVDLDIWGPDFSGKAHIKYYIISFEVHFGSGASQSPLPLTWGQFENAFLPKKNQLAVSIQQGLVKQSNDGTDYAIINPKELVIEVESVVPLLNAYYGTGTTDPIPLVGANTKIGIGPMDIQAGTQWTSTLQVNLTCITCNDKVVAWADFEEHFGGQSGSAFAILKNVPAALWGGNFQPDIHSDALIANACTGIRLQPQPVDNEYPLGVDKANLLWTKIPFNSNYDFDTGALFKVDPNGSRDDISNSLKNNRAARSEILKSLGLRGNVDLSDAISGQFSKIPQITQA